MSRVLPLFLLLIAGCGGKSTASPEPAPTEEPAPAPDVTPEPVPEPAPATPASLYAECEQLVEGKTADGECKKAEDCEVAGCSKEVCVSVANAKDVMTACVEKDCFKVLDTCGCNEGKCSWSLKDEIPKEDGKPGKKLPTSLPPTGPPPTDGRAKKGGE